MKILRWREIQKITALTFLLFSCVTETKPPESPLEYLNGEKYQARGPMIQGIPVGGIERLQNETKISGRVVVGGDENYEVPVKFQKMVLMQDDKVIIARFTDEKGDFLITEKLQNGFYRIKLDSDRFIGEWKIEVKGYNLESYSYKAIRKPK